MFLICFASKTGHSYMHWHAFAQYQSLFAARSSWAAHADAAQSMQSHCESWPLQCQLLQWVQWDVYYLKSWTILDQDMKSLTMNDTTVPQTWGRMRIHFRMQDCQNDSKRQNLAKMVKWFWSRNSTTECFYFSEWNSLLVHMWLCYARDWQQFRSRPIWSTRA